MLKALKLWQRFLGKGGLSVNQVGLNRCFGPRRETCQRFARVELPRRRLALQVELLKSFCESFVESVGKSFYKRLIRALRFDPKL